MTVAAKICGISTTEAMDAATAGGARWVGLVFYPPSPRAVDTATAAELAARVPDGTGVVGLFVDPDDETIAEVADGVRLDLLQLHGEESPERVAAIRRRYALPVMKAIKIAGAADVAGAAAYFDAADMLLFDARAPKDMKGALPGGNALAFDWRLIADRDWPLPWMLSGGLDAGNVAEAVATSGATRVDVSSGVESAPGRKDPARIRAFLDAVRAL